MSFRSRLSLFFVGIVIVPMIAATVAVLLLLAYSDTGKADARVANGQTAAINLFEREVDRASVTAGRAGADAAFTAAIMSGDRAAARTRARQLLRELPARRLAVTRRRRPLVDVGARTATAATSRELVASSGRPVGRLQVSLVTATQYANLVRRVTDLQVVVRRGGATLASTLRGVGDRSLPPTQGDVEVGAREYRVASFSSPGFGAAPARVYVLADRADTATNQTGGRTLAAIALAAFLLVAFGLALAVSRSLQAQIDRFLDGARRLAAGDFSQEVPTEGNDEFAALGEEFNKMSRQLESRLEELRQERARLEDSIRRIGETFASNLDRGGLLEIVVRTAVDAVSADAGRAAARDGPRTALTQRAATGELGRLGEAVHAVEALAQESTKPAHSSRDGYSAMAFPLNSEDGEVVALLSVARSGREFSQGERGLFHYLARQAATSLENVDLHELVQRQAVTDELTGLSNHRRFQDLLLSEVERARRFGHNMGLIMLDIDNFKRINDTYGHQQGDLVLREVGRVVRETSRDIDEPARYGGEEMAVALPETDLEGAFNLAERIREAIAALEIPCADADGPLRVTASFGAAALPHDASASSRYDRAGLVAAADEALYRAKRRGKNRTERAQGTAAGAGRGG